MRQLGERNYALLKQGIQVYGNYNPDAAMAYNEELFLVREYDTVRAFMAWVHEDEDARGFGDGNYETRFNQFMAETGRVPEPRPQPRRRGKRRWLFIALDPQLQEHIVTANSLMQAIEILKKHTGLTTPQILGGFRTKKMSTIPELNIGG